MPESLFRKIKGVLGLKALDKQKGTQTGFPFLSTLRNSTLMIFPFLSPTATFCTLAVGFSALPAKAKVKKTSKRVSQQSEIIHP